MKVKKDMIKFIVIKILKGNKINDSYCLINKYPMAEERKNKEKLIYLEKLNIFKRTYWNNEHINNLYLKKVNNNETNSISIEK